MAGVFGTSITEQTVRATGEYPEPITQKNCADYALQTMNSGGKDINAVKYVDNLKDDYGNGIATKCLIYNATGTTITFADSTDWHGHIYKNPYPTVIQNGQWGAFLHVHPSAWASGSAGAAVYGTDVRNSGYDPCDFLFTWSIPYIGDNRVYTEIREKGHFPKHWNYIYDKKLENSSRHSIDKGYGYVSDTTIGEGTTVEAHAIFKFA